MKTLNLISNIGGEQRQYELAFHAGESVYEIAARYAVKLPVSCRNGVCHICRAHLIEGEVMTGPRKQPVSIRQTSREQNEGIGRELMLCQTWPLGTCQIEVNNVYGPGELAVNKAMCRVLKVALIKGHVYQVELQLPAGKLPEFYAGQYLALDIPGKDEPCYFSIASRPGLRELTLHIQADPHLSSAVEVVEYLKACLDERKTLALSLPFGKACLTHTPDQPLILVAAGTGFAQMKSIIEHLFSVNYQHEIALYWGVRKEQDLYHSALAEEWAERYENFSFHSLVADIENIDANAHHNQLSDAVLADHQVLENSQVFVSGSPKLVFSAMDALIDAGLPEKNFYSDVLEYAPRS
jgi:CDP-4-dehydro-6-deoxyglucose reductase